MMFFTLLTNYLSILNKMGWWKKGVWMMEKNAFCNRHKSWFSWTWHENLNNKVIVARALLIFVCILVAYAIFWFSLLYFESIFSHARNIDKKNLPKTFVSVQMSGYDSCKCKYLTHVVCLNRYYGWYFNVGIKL